MRPVRPYSIKPLALVLAVGVSLTACGTSGKDGSTAAKSSPSPLPTLGVAELSKLTKQQLDTRKNVRVRVTGKQGKDALDISMVMSRSAGSLDFDMTFPMPQDGGNIHIIKFGKDTYIETPPGEKPIEPGKPWAKVPAGSKNPLGATFNLMGTMFTKMADPDQSMLSLVQDAQSAAKVTSVKEEAVGAARTMHYSISVDLEQMIQKMDVRKLFTTALGQITQLKGLPGVGTKPQQAADALGNLSDAKLAKIRAGMLKETRGIVLTQEVWVDEQNLPVKQVMTAPSKKGRPAVPITTTFTDWGKASITPPPADKVTVLPDKFTG